MSAERVTQLIEAGLWLRMSGDINGARRLFEQALRLDPENAQAKQLLAAPTRPSATPLDATVQQLPREFAHSPVPAPRPFGAVESPSRSGVPGTPAPARARQPTPAPLRPVTPPPPSIPAMPVIPPLGRSETPIPLTRVKRRATPVPDEVIPIDLGPDSELIPEPLIPRSAPPVDFAPAPVASPGNSAPVEIPAVAPLSPLPPLSMLSTSVGSPTTPFGYLEAPPAPPTAWDAGGKPSFNLTPSPDRGRDALDVLKENAPIVPPSRTPLPTPGIQRDLQIRNLLGAAGEQMGLDNHTGALELILQAQALDPESAQIAALKEKSEKTLQSMYESKLGTLSSVPRVRMKDDEVIWLNLDHRAGFVLAQVDGSVSYEDLFLVSGMSRLDTARILFQLKDEGVIA